MEMGIDIVEFIHSSGQGSNREMPLDRNCDAIGRKPGSPLLTPHL